ncbi:MAG TPA: hypothetical protein VFE19_14380, partial [Jatrophihabitantaceae bacterium]|nr:hypothetical protein [Jatrophihabitantaceae bacterium]
MPRLAAAADSLQCGALPQLTAAYNTIEALLADPAQAASTPDLDAVMADLQSQITDITSASTGVATTVLAYKRAQYAHNHAILHPAQTSIAASSTAAATADQEVLTVEQALATAGYSSSQVRLRARARVRRREGGEARGRGPRRIPADPRPLVPATLLTSPAVSAEGVVSWFRTSEWGVSRHRHSVSQVFGMVDGSQAAACRNVALSSLLFLPVS